MSFALEETLRATIVAGGFLLILAGAEIWRRRGAPPVEWTRKAVHFFGGLLAASFPWILRSHWTVLALAVTLGTLLWLSRRLELLRSVHGVERRSEGALYFPVAVYLLFLLSADEPVFYLISVLVLVVADAAAAVLGRTYGRTHYAVETDERSLEGSVVFFMTTFLIVHLPLLLLTGVEPAASVAVAAQIALLVTFFEAVSLRGNDNIIVPLGTLYLLVKLTPVSADVVAVQLGLQLAIIAVTVWVGIRFRFLRASGAIALSLFFFGAYTLGGPEWLLAPALALTGFIVAKRHLRPGNGFDEDRYQVLALFYVGLVPAVLFIANNTFETLVPGPAWLTTGSPFYPLFVGSVGAHLGILCWTLSDPASDPDRTHMASARSGVLSAVGATALIVSTGILLGPEPVATAPAAAAVAVSLGGATWFALWRHHGGGRFQGVTNVRLQALSVGLAVLLVLPVHLWLRM